MAQPIKWRGADADITGAARNLLSAQSSGLGAVNSGVAGLQKLFADRIDKAKERTATETEMNTENVLRKLQSGQIDTLGGYNSNEDVFSDKNIFDTLGRDVDLTAVQEARDARVGKLRGEAETTAWNTSKGGIGPNPESILNSRNAYDESLTQQGMSEKFKSKLLSEFDAKAQPLQTTARTNQDYNRKVDLDNRSGKLFSMYANNPNITEPEAIGQILQDVTNPADRARFQTELRKRSDEWSALSDDQKATLESKNATRKRNEVLADTVFKQKLSSAQADLENSVAISEDSRNFGKELAGDPLVLEKKYKDLMTTGWLSGGLDAALGGPDDITTGDAGFKEFRRVFETELGKGEYSNSDVAAMIDQTMQNTMSKHGTWVGSTGFNKKAFTDEFGKVIARDQEYKQKERNIGKLQTDYLKKSTQMKNEHAAAGERDRKGIRRGNRTGSDYKPKAPKKDNSFYSGLLPKNAEGSDTGKPLTKEEQRKVDADKLLQTQQQETVPTPEPVRIQPARTPQEEQRIVNEPWVRNAATGPMSKADFKVKLGNVGTNIKDSVGGAIANTYNTVKGNALPDRGEWGDLGTAVKSGLNKMSAPGTPFVDYNDNPAESSKQMQQILSNTTNRRDAESILKNIQNYDAKVEFMHLIDLRFKGE
jgi:hypothetical protein